MKGVLGVLGIVSAVVLNLVIWTVIAAFVTVGLAAADVGATTFYVTWVFFAAVMVAGAVLTIRWGKEGRRWLWRISISWTLLFLITVITLGLAVVVLALLSIHPGFRRWLTWCLIPPRPAMPSATSPERLSPAGKDLSGA